MSDTSGNAIEEGKIDLVPLIDCVLLLLLFFILTSRFTSDDLVLSTVLPPESGLPITTHTVPDPPPRVRVVITPRDGQVLVRMGGAEPFAIDMAALRQPVGTAMTAALDALHASVAEHLAVYEQPGERSAQVPIEIHCASRLPWRCAASVYDAVFAYEKAHGSPDQKPGTVLRQIAFGAPSVRNVRDDGEREELERLWLLR